MNNLTAEQIQERYDKLPPQLQQVIASPDIQAAINRIGRDQGLMIDQIGGLIDQIGLVILGFAKASAFVSDISARLSIADDQAQALTEKINAEILGQIRRDIDKNQALIEEAEMENTKEDHISALEQAGGFEIERPAGTLPTSNSANLLQKDVPAPAPVEYPKKEPLVTQLLRGDTATPAAPTAPKKPIPPITPRYSGNDPYRESVE